MYHIFRWPVECFALNNETCLILRRAVPVGEWADRKKKKCQEEQRGKGKTREGREQIECGWLLQTVLSFETPSHHRFPTANISASVPIYSQYRTIYIYKVKMTQSWFFPVTMKSGVVVLLLNSYLLTQFGTFLCRGCWLYGSESPSWVGEVWPQVSGKQPREQFCLKWRERTSTTHPYAIFGYLHCNFALVACPVFYLAKLYPSWIITVINE